MSNALSHKAPEEIIEEQLDGKIGEIETILDADMMTFFGRIAYGADDLIRDEVEAINPKRKRL